VLKRPACSGWEEIHIVCLALLKKTQPIASTGINRADNPNVLVAANPLLTLKRLARPNLLCPQPPFADPPVTGLRKVNSSIHCKWKIRRSLVAASTPDSIRTVRSVREKENDARTTNSPAADWMTSTVRRFQCYLWE
jgi:hypothetical protein